MKVSITPLFKYAGSKARMLENYEPFFVGLEEKTTFVDYFGGTGTVAMWIKALYPHMNIILNEKSLEIYGLYKALKYEYEEFMCHLRALDSHYTDLMTEGLARGLSREQVARPRPRGPEYWKSREAFYYGLRDRYADAPKSFCSGAEKAAALYFMLQTNFSGIWQTRSHDGVYYTPFGLGKEINSRIDGETLNRFHLMLQDAEIFNKDFRELEDMVPSSGVVHYFDPPYIQSHTKYQKGGFSVEDTEDLCQLILRLHEKGEMVFLSNKDGKELRRSLQGPLRFELFPVQYTAGRKNSEKGSRAIEVLFHNNKKVPFTRTTVEEYQEVISSRPSDYFVGKMSLFGSTGCWLWNGYFQIKKEIEERVHSLKLYPNRVLWCIVNKRILPKSVQLIRTCKNRKCCNPLHQRCDEDIETFPRLIGSFNFNLTIE